MATFNLLLGIAIPLLVFVCYADANTDDEVSKFLKTVNQRLAKLYDEENLAKWQKEISGSDNTTKVDIAAKQTKDYIHSIVESVAKYRKLNLKNSDLQRQLRLIPISYEVLPSKEYEAIATLAINSAEAFQKVLLCSYKDKKVCNLKFLPDVMTINLESENNDEKVFYWQEWREKAGAYVKKSYMQFVDLYRKAAKISGFSTAADLRYKAIDESGAAVLKTLEKINTKLEPLYKQTHAYLRGKMREKYGAKLIETNMPLPDHLYMPFADNATRSASNVEELPFNTIRLPNITDFLQKKGKTVKQNFDTAEKFLTSLGLPQLDKSFWQKNCAPSGEKNKFLQENKVWTIYGQHQVNFTYSTVNEELQFFYMFAGLSDVYYNQAFKNLDTLYQQAGILYMNKAVGNFFSLAASSPKYLESLGISFPNYKTKEARINRLYAKGLGTFGSFSLFYSIELLQVGLIDKSLDINDNCAVWSLFEKLQGVQPPVPRSKSNFDSAPSLIIQYDGEFATNIYMLVLEYQMFHYYCTSTGQHVKNDPAKPLDLCDLSGQPKVGQQIYKAMALGASVSSKAFLKALVGSEELDVGGYLEYYKPLVEWVESENKKKNYEVGWKSVKKCK